MRFLIFILIFIINSSTFALDDEANDSYPVNSQAVLEEYLELDANGAWLTKNGRKKLSMLMTSEIHLVHEISPYIIRSYRIVSTSIKKNTATIYVEYDLIGETENFITFEKYNTCVTKEFELVKEGRYWRIKSYMPPYMDWKVVIKQIKFKRDKAKAKLDRIKDEKKKKKYQVRLNSYLKNIETVISDIEEESQKPGSESKEPKGSD